jgi:hypothetical protein
LATSVVLPPVASADIVGIQAAQTCDHDSNTLPSGTLTQGGVYCTATGGGFSLIGILNDTIELPVNNSQTPSFNIINDTGLTLTSLTLYYSGSLASNASIDMQTRNPFMDWSCKAVDANGVTTSSANCGSSDVTADDPAVPLKLTWTGGTGVAAGGTFNLWTASFAHAGQDAGNFVGTVPDGGATITMLGGVLIVLGSLRRRLVKKAL